MWRQLFLFIDRFYKFFNVFFHFIGDSQIVLSNNKRTLKIVSINDLNEEVLTIETKTNTNLVWIEYI